MYYLIKSLLTGDYCKVFKKDYLILYKITEFEI